MVKKSKKSKSKRVPLRKKYKIIRKVKEHEKKKTKEAKKLGINKRPKVEKDPGIPNDWPFKEQELKALEVRRQRAIDDLEAKKAARKERAKKRKLGLLEDEEIKGGEEGMNVNPTSVTRKADNLDRAFYKELVKVIEASDVILEVLDARDPLGTRCVDMEKMVLSAGPDKQLVLLLNKIDLVPREAAEKWLTYLREELPAVAFKCSTQKQKSNLGRKSAPKAGKGGKASNVLQTSDCLGAETLTKLLKHYSRSHEVATVRGKLKKGGGVDVDATARIILHDWNEGKIPYYTMPPTRNADEPSEARIVTEIRKEFNVDEVYGSETTFVGSLKSMNDFNPVEVPSNSPLNFDMLMLEDKEAPQGNDEDQPMESGEEDEQGDAKRRKADAKRRVKDNNQPSTMEHDGNADYDFKIDYVKEPAMETGDEVEAN
ncbi:guanine nucleotide-binding protein-like NSN1 isoform X2 [Salvia hispanica]|uniref:guanine nucleotide-binding protein-like NSN1 isoform X2 n=1 Tax=Salvia hispanica TaxID=49212 RepID=UPI002008EF9F|nr:guanine nucleotide-binding protein-like NSN1 isoform X2 [Salvia hispanica]